MVKNGVIYRTFVHIAQKKAQKSQKVFFINPDSDLTLVEQMCYTMGATEGEHGMCSDNTITEENESTDLNFHRSAIYFPSE